MNISYVYTKKGIKPCDNSKKSFIDTLEDSEFKTLFLDPKERDKVIKIINENMIKYFKGVEVEGDPVIQIGTVFHRYGEDKPYKRHILVIGPPDKPDEKICDPLTDYDIDVEECKSEEELLLGWKRIMKKEDPDFVTGYNIFGFDFAYMLDRMNIYCKCKKRYCEKNCPKNRFLDLGKINSIYAFSNTNKRCKEVKKKTSSFGSVDYNRYLHMDGRIIFDLQKEVEKGHNLESYKLDNVAAHFMRGKIKNITSYKNINSKGSIAMKTI